MSTQTPREDMSCNRKRRKVRKSCNACSSQKIRCGKQSPKCQRCEAKGLECAYSMSMRTGERPRIPASPRSLSGDHGMTTPLALRDGPLTAMSNTSPVSIISHVSHISQHQHQQQQQERERRLSGQSSEQSSEHRVDFHDEMMWLWEGTSDSDNFMDQGLCFDGAADFGIATNLTDLALSPTKPSSAAAMLTPMTHKYHAASLFDQPPLGGHGFPARPEHAQQQQQQQQQQQPRCSDTADSARSGSVAYSDDRPRPQPPQPPTPRCAARIHDCTLEVLGIVSDFHVPAQGCLTVAKGPGGTCAPLSSSSSSSLLLPLPLPLPLPHPGSHPLDDDTPREMGTVLSHNREILHRLNDLLDCRCFMRQEVLVLVYVAVYKALGWYAAVLGDDGSSEEDQGSQFALFDRIATTTSFVGSYCLDNDSQRVVAAHLVLTHLWEYVDPLVKRLRHWHPSSATHATKGRMSNIIDQHHQALQEELERITSRANSIKHT